MNTVVEIKPVALDHSESKFTLNKTNTEYKLREFDINYDPVSREEQNNYQINKIYIINTGLCIENQTGTFNKTRYFIP